MNFACFAHQPVWHFSAKDGAAVKAGGLVLLLREFEPPPLPMRLVYLRRPAAAECASFP